MKVVGAAGILHRHSYRVLTGGLALGRRRDVDPDELADIPGQGAGGSGAGFLGDGEQRMHIDGWFAAAFDDGLQCRQQRGDASLVIQVAGADVAVLGEFRHRIEGDEITDVDPQRAGFVAAVGIGVQAQLDVVPAHRCFIHGGIEGMPRCEQRQYATADNSGIGEDTDAAALGEAARPAAHRRQAQAAGILNLANNGADGVQVRRDGAIRAVAPALECGADGPAAGQLVGDAQLGQALGNIAHNCVGESGGAGDGEHLQQHALHVVEIGFGEFCGHESSC